MSLVPARVKLHAESHPQSPFCTIISSSGARSITYREFYAAGCAYAREYMRRGIGPGDVVLIMLQHTPHLFYSFLGATLAGAIPSFMPFPSGKQRAELFWIDHAALFERLRPALIVSYAKNIADAHETLRAFAIDALLADDALLAAPAATHDELPGLSAQADDIVCLQHSSGTTGLKKGVMLSHRTILRHVDSYAHALAFSAADRIVSWLPLYHDMGFIACFMLSIIEGTQLIALDPFEWSARPSILLDAITAYRPTLCWLPNFAFSHLVRTFRGTKHTDLRSVRAFINCSEPCKTATIERFAERFGEFGVDRSSLAVCYAMAENVFAVTQTRLGQLPVSVAVDANALAQGIIAAAQPNEPATSFLSCGSPIDGVELRICSADGSPLPAGTIGEVHVGGDSLFAGYYAQPELTRSRLHEGWYATGDMGFVHERELYITGRVDDLIVVNGRNYYAHEIESLVGMVPGAAPGRIAAIGVSDDASDVNGIVVLAEFDDSVSGAADLAREIRATVLERLGVSVARVVPLRTGSLIKTTSGKISRIKNRQLYIEDQFSDCAMLS